MSRVSYAPFAMPAAATHIRVVLVALTLLAVGCGDDDGPAPDPDAGTEVDAGPVVIVLPDEREACADRDELRRPFFGDLHVHSVLSFDAAAFDVRSRPADAYAFARGEPIGLPPYDAAGAPTRTLRLARPLDFAAVTDHAEFLAETAACIDPTSAGFDTRTCQSYRDADTRNHLFGELTDTFIFSVPRRPSLCRVMPELCAALLGAAWQETMDAAEASYDRTSACTFTTFPGYEWTGSTGGNNFHRNVIFRTRSVPRVPTSYIEAPTAEALWDALEETCIDTGTPCDVLAIPHNANLAGGTMFVPTAEDGAPYDRAFAERRAALEPLVELYQHKGASECVHGLPDPLASEDELCGFEQLHAPLCTGAATDPEDCTDLCSRTGGIGFLGGCVEPRDFARGTLRTGLLEQQRMGGNPFRLGFIGSTDTHSNTPGAVEEDGWGGHLGDSDDEPAEQLLPDATVLVRGITTSPGGLAVIWSEENSRESLFDAMRRRETYATSGTRIVARFFGGWAYAPDLCDDPEMVRRGYEQGVPMGGELPAGPDGAAPTFVLSALRDALGVPLSHIQIIKGWVEGAETRERIYDVAGDADSGATVDVTTCTPSGPGADSLCAVWIDPDFDPTVPAFWYARVLENPTCRWSQRVCLEAGVDCAAIDPEDAFAPCCDPSVPQTTQERAWTSPIWYTPSPPTG